MGKQTSVVAEMRNLGLANYRNRMKTLRRGETPACKRIMKAVLPQVGEALEKEFAFYSDRQNNPPRFMMYVIDLDPWEIGLVTCREIFNMMDEIPKIQSAALAISRAVEDIAKRVYFEDNAQHWDEFLLDKKQKAFKGVRRTQQEIFFEECEKHQNMDGWLRFSSWEPKLKVQLGVWLFEQARLHSGLFEVILRKRPGKYMSEKHFKPTDKFADWIRRFDGWKELMSPQMLVTPDEPMDWVGSNVGGYDHEGSLPRLTFVKQRTSLKDMHVLFPSVNKIQKVKWKVNEQVLEVADRSWREDLQIGGMPPMEDIPVEAWFDGDCKSDEFKSFKARKRRAIEKNLALWGRRQRTLKTVYVGNWMKQNRPNGFYFPHNIDYRGRAYPLPSYVNPQSDDLGRSFLLFHKGVEIVDQEDLDWILIHGANCFGKKGTFDERIQWIQSRADCIVASAEDPIGEQWWTEASDPWMFLAFCFEYKKWKDEGFGYLSHLPVAQDASNNGIQLMSLLLRDEKVARRVNLVPDQPIGDMYQEVMDRVVETLRKQRSKNAFAAAWLKFGVDRSYSKPVVMARPYGATGWNNVDLMMEVYEKQVDKSYRPFERGESVAALNYLSRLINKEVDAVMPMEMDLMRWLRSLYHDGVLSWTSPLGYTIYVDVPTFKKIDVTGVVNSLHDRCYVMEENGIDDKRIRRSFVANFVHSLDASILHRVAQQMEFDMAFVHDSFACHAPNVRAMKRTLLRTYEEIFSRNLLEELSQELAVQQGTEPQSPPQFGTLDVSQIHRCKYVYH